MSFTASQAATLAHRVPYRSLLVQDPTADQLFGVMPWVRIQERSVEITALALSDAGHSGEGRWDSSGAAREDDSPTTVMGKEFALKRAVRHVLIDRRAVDAEGGPDVQVEAQVRLNREVLVNTLGDGIVNGDSSGGSGPEFDGLAKLAEDASQRVYCGGGLSFAKIDDLLGKIQVNGGRPHYLVGNNELLTAYTDLWTTANAAPPSTFDPLTGIELPAYRGIPLLRCDHVATQSGTPLKTSLFALCLGEGLGLAMAAPTSTGELGYVVKTWEDTGNGRLHVESSWTCVLVLYRYTALAQLYDIDL